MPLAQMPRLAPLLTSLEGEAAFVLAFETDEENRAIVRVRVSAEVEIECQRCLNGMSWSIDESSTLAVVTGPDEAERLPDEFDPLLLDGERFALRSLIEDELILAVPAAPAHKPDECAVQISDVNTHESTGESDRDSREDNPFAVLANWKNDDKSQD